MHEKKRFAKYKLAYSRAFKRHFDSTTQWMEVIRISNQILRPRFNRTRERFDNDLLITFAVFLGPFRNERSVPVNGLCWNDLNLCAVTYIYVIAEVITLDNVMNKASVNHEVIKVPTEVALGVYSLLLDDWIIVFRVPYFKKYQQNHKLHSGDWFLIMFLLNVGKITVNPRFPSFYTFEIHW